MDHLNQELHSANWRKSSLSGSDGSNCVEIANLSTNHRAIRDSKNPTAPALILTPTSGPPSSLPSRTATATDFTCTFTKKPPGHILGGFSV